MLQYLKDALQSIKFYLFNFTYNYNSELEKYILSKKPNNSADIDFLLKTYEQEKSKGFFL